MSDVNTFLFDSLYHYIFSRKKVLTLQYNISIIIICLRQFHCYSCNIICCIHYHPEVIFFSSSSSKSFRCQNNLILPLLPCCFRETNRIFSSFNLQFRISNLAPTRSIIIGSCKGSTIPQVIFTIHSTPRRFRNSFFLWNNSSIIIGMILQYNTFHHNFRIFGIPTKIKYKLQIGYIKSCHITFPEADRFIGSQSNSLSKIKDIVITTINQFYHYMRMLCSRSQNRRKIIIFISRSSNVRTNKHLCLPCVCCC